MLEGLTAWVLLPAVAGLSLSQYLSAQLWQWVFALLREQLAGRGWWPMAEERAHSEPAEVVPSLPPTIDVDRQWYQELVRSYMGQRPAPYGVPSERPSFDWSSCLTGFLACLGICVFLLVLLLLYFILAQGQWSG